MVKAHKQSARRDVIAGYLERRQLYPFQVCSPPRAPLGIAVVVPCFDEPDIAQTLESLSQCAYPGCNVEVMVVINAPDGATPSALMRNTGAAETAATADRRSPEWLTFHVVRHEKLAASRAGVGMARRIGMDEAAHRLNESGSPRGVLASLDADCTVAPNYFESLMAHFGDQTTHSAASLYFEHRSSDNPDIDAAIVDYELHLRYYVQGQRYAGFPFAYHTIGSALACRAIAYAAQGGMNLRQAGEDFYFAQKMIATGGYSDLASTTVYPAPRPSARVPFGTGPAISRAMSGQPILTYAPQVFVDLKAACEAIERGEAQGMTERLRAISPAVAEFLDRQNVAATVAEVAANTATPKSRRKRLFRWFNAFRFMKFAQFVSRSHYPKAPVATAAAELAALAGWQQDGRGSSAQWLDCYRDRDRRCLSPPPQLG